MKFLFYALLLLAAACSFKKGQLGNQTSNGHEELYSQPEAPKPVAGYRKITIAATNDLHAQYRAQEISFKDLANKEKQSVEVGGVDIISSYFKIIREQNGEILLVDSGDIFSQKTSQLPYVQSFYTALGYDAVTVGLKDFNLRIPEKFTSNTEYFKAFAKSSKTPLLLGNLYDVKTGRIVEWPGAAPYILKEVNGVKIGVIGIIPDDVITQTPVDNRVGLFLEGMLQATLRQARLLRSLGAELIVVISHQGINCGEKIAQELKLPISKVNFEPRKNDVCELSNKMGEYLNRLPPKLVDVVIGGRNHLKTANYVDNVLVMSNFPDGKSFSYVEFFAEEKTKKINHEMTLVHQPVMLCREFFKETMDCYTEDESVDHKVRIPAMFLGKQIEPDPEMDKKFEIFTRPNQAEDPKAMINPEEILKTHGADISFRSKGTGQSKFVILTVSGYQLISLLERDLNAGKANSWQPSPFMQDSDEIELKIMDQAIIPSGFYKILVDADDAQAHAGLRKFIGRLSTRSLVSFSWESPFMTDDVSISMAASETER